MGLTQLQWLQRGYVLKPGATGKERCYYCCYSRYAMFYTKDEVVYNKEQADAEMKEWRREIQARYRERVRAKHNRTKHTAWQWINKGYVPSDRAEWVQDGTHYAYETEDGEYIEYTNKYYYCRGDSVRKNRRRATKLLEQYNNTILPTDGSIPPYAIYDGRPWW